MKKLLNFLKISEISELLENKRAIAILYIKDNKVIHEAYYNCQEDTFFNIGSIAKFFIAAVIKYLEDENKLYINDKVFNYINNFPFKSVTIKDLLYHESGIVDYYLLFPEEEYREITNESALKRVYETKLEFRPGTRFSYSNSNYVILYELIKKITKKSYLNILNKVIYNTNPGIMEYVTHQNTSDKLIPSYVNNHVNTNDTLTLGDGGIIGSMSFFKNYLLKTTFLQNKPHRSQIDDKFTEHYEYGYTFDAKDGLLYQGGSYMGYRSILAIQPDKNKKCVVLANDDRLTLTLRKKIIRELLNN